MTTATKDIDQELWDSAGPLSPMRRPDAEEDWVTINAMGHINHPEMMDSVSLHVAKIMRRRVQDWLECDLADFQAFSMCQLRNKACSAGFVGTENHKPDDCVFGAVKDEVTGKQACCYTVLVDGVTVLDLLTIVSDYYDSGHVKVPRNNEKFRRWCRGMINFYKNVIHRAYLEE